MDGSRISIGKDCGISGVSFCSMQEIRIGDRVQIGANTKILDNDMHSMNAEVRALDIREKIRRYPMFVGDGCFIGAQCIILKGSRFGNKCIFAAGSVVHGTWLDNSIIAGNPAKLIGNNN